MFNTGFSDISVKINVRLSSFNKLKIISWFLLLFVIFSVNVFKTFVIFSILFFSNLNAFNSDINKEISFLILFSSLSLFIFILIIFISKKKKNYF
jgi:hypothetical protein